MPSGSVVYVVRYKTVFNLDVWVVPLRADAYRTTGLCGNYNLNWRDDQPAAGGYYCTTNCEAHRHGTLIA